MSGFGDSSAAADAGASAGGRYSQAVQDAIEEMARRESAAEEERIRCEIIRRIKDEWVSAGYDGYAEQGPALARLAVFAFEDYYTDRMKGIRR